jgi:F0F1-type ATP synthase alpha subunit
MIQALVPVKKQSQDLDFFMIDDLEFHVLEAYRILAELKADDEPFVPEILELEDLFMDLILQTELKVFNYKDYLISIYEIKYGILEDILMNMKFEFISIIGEHVGECQKVMYEEMM